MTATKVLFIQHAGSLGGSTRSLLNTALGLRARGFESQIALIRPNAPVVDLYRSHDLSVIPWEGIDTFEHTTLDWADLRRPLSARRFAIARSRARKTRERTRALVAATNAALVHLNSVVLVESAEALSAAGIRFVWHVREPPVPGYFGFRLRHIRRELCARNVEPIFLTESERSAWMGRPGGTVIHNFVDLDRFTSRDDRDATRLELGASADTVVLLYLGGLGEAKGWSVLLRALAQLDKKRTPILCIMPDTMWAPPASIASRIGRAVLPLIGGGSAIQLFEKLLTDLSLGEHIRRLPYVHDVGRLIAASDLIVFPSTRPHFARPVIEGAAFGRPAVASDWPGMKELVEAGATGLLVEPNNATALATALQKLIDDTELRSRMGAAARSRALSLFSADIQITKLIEVYERILGRP